MRKTRSDAAFLAMEGLEDDEQRQIIEWLLTPQLGYKKVAALVKKEFGIPCNYGALDEFFQSYVAPYLIAKRQRAVGVAQQVGQDIREAPGTFNKVTIDALEQKAFELANNPMSNPKDVKAIFTLVLKAWSEQRKGEEFGLSKKKFQRDTAELFIKWSADERAKQVLASGATQSDMIEAIGRAMFEDWDES